jgi:hypothetical protein
MTQLNLRQEAQAHKPTVSCLPSLRAAAIQTWRGRMVNEHGSARVFEGLASQLEAAGVDALLVAECRGFAAEERRHGVLCGAVVESLGGEALAEITAPEVFPLHHDATPLEAALRNLLSISCLSETVAVALIGAERLEMPDGELRELLTRIYADECGHCNFGWRSLGELLPDDPALKERLSKYLMYAFEHVERHELSHLPEQAEWPPEGAHVGLCSGRDARALFYATIEQVILPGLEARGLSARYAWENRASVRPVS